MGGGVVAYVVSRGDKRADALLACKTGRFNEVEKVLNELIARHPDDLEVRECLARGYASADRPADAEPHLTKLLEAKPQDYMYLRLRMEQYGKLNQREEEYADARRLLELDPDDKMRRKVIRLAFEVGRVDEAEKLCRAALRDEPKDRGLKLMMADIRQAQGDDKGAAEILDQLIRDDPKNYGALLSRGILYHENDRSDLAVPLLRRVFDEDPTRRRTSGTELAKALGKLGQQAEADRVLSEVRRLQDVEVFGVAVKTQPTNLDLNVRLAESLLRDGHTADGLRMLEMVLAQDPAHRGAHLALAAHYDKQGQTALAAEHRRQAGKSP